MEPEEPTPPAPIEPWPKPLKYPKRIPVTQGVRRDHYGYEAYVKCAGHQWSQRFSANTPMRVIKKWRLRTRLTMLEKYKPEKAPRLWGPPPEFPRVEKPLKKSPDGWCYLYIVQSDHHVKIGRTLDPAQRLSELQTAHHVPLKLVCAIPAHAALERAVHERFKEEQREGEWFKVTKHLKWFIDELCAGKNPVALLWE